MCHLSHFLFPFVLYFFFQPLKRFVCFIFLAKFLPIHFYPLAFHFCCTTWIKQGEKKPHYMLEQLLPTGHVEHVLLFLFSCCFLVLTKCQKLYEFECQKDLLWMAGWCFVFFFIWFLLLLLVLCCVFLLLLL